VRSFLREVLLHRLLGVRHRPRRSPLALPRRRGGVEVRGCGCCLPIPLGLLTSAGLGLRVVLRARS
jgi:hypothetical protein